MQFTGEISLETRKSTIFFLKTCRNSRLTISGWPLTFYKNSVQIPYMIFHNNSVHSVHKNTFFHANQFEVINYRSYNQILSCPPSAPGSKPPRNSQRPDSSPLTDWTAPGGGTKSRGEFSPPPEKLRGDSPLIPLPISALNYEYLQNIQLKSKYNLALQKHPLPGTYQEVCAPKAHEIPPPRGRGKNCFNRNSKQT